MINFDTIEKIILMIASGLISGLIVYFFTIRVEKYKFDIYKRKQSEKVAELFAAWIRKKKIIKGDEEYCEKLNCLAWGLAIWIPDEKLVKKIMDRLANENKALSIKKIIIEMREFILQSKSTELKSSDLIHFTPPERKNNINNKK